MLALRRGLQEALHRLGRVPEWHQTDNSTAATHDLRTGKRGFNAEYERLMDRFGMKPRTIGIGESHQNGDIEAGNGALKRRLEQHLLLRGDRDFPSVEAYETWLWEVCQQANALRSKRVIEERAAMRVLEIERMAEYRELSVRVTSNSTIRVLKNTYSVPSRLRGEQLKVRIYEMRVEVFYGGLRQFAVDRLLGRNRHRIDYRHVIWSLVKKPGAFVRYRYREDLFPTTIFRRAYDALAEGLDQRHADLEYLRVLHRAAATMQCEVEAALELLLSEKQLPRFEAVRSLVTDRSPEIPEMAPLAVDLSGYDQLLRAEAGR
jgi:hypothetical protein